MDDVVTTDVDFDVIVVGAGVAGCVTAHQLATKGHSVLLVERGQNAGSKNLSGGVFYCRIMEEIMPGFLDEAPVERRITRNCLSFLSETSFVNVDYGDARLGQSVTAVSVLRAKLDEWLATKCEEAGVMLMSGVKVETLVMENERIVGIRAGDDELRAHVVVAADGVNSFICRDAGIRAKEPTKHLAVGVKSVIGLPRKVIEERFNLTGDEGAAYAVVGDCTNGIGGGGFLYTNLESLSVGVVLRLDDLVSRGDTSSELHDRFLSHPAIEPFLRGGELLEYGCHMVAEGGQAMVHDLTRPGLVVVGEAAGFALNTGFTVRGMDLAAGSGLAAARAIDAALLKGDFSKSSLDAYSVELDNIFVGKDMRTYARAPQFLENPRMYGAYGQLLSDVMYSVYNLDTTPRQHLLPGAMAAFKKSPMNLIQLVKDMYAGVRAL
ncbi:FAD-dependent oxidoreductase [Desulfosporosinus fructosivorans]|uniref:FAD-dependent oxidoreductase n=1 Tax=Desulfosporosinus fructosivorans TaxID=2018669 RepID=A0A4Z0R927_9FIRM|nr:FAD-dependent oxidoreductase [Desulfosporosinus fructosivorans]TGE39330.1 FAD-dependent oxidoreductase [Desulfosporosinus fructosivorans]